MVVCRWAWIKRCVLGLGAALLLPGLLALLLLLSPKPDMQYFTRYSQALFDQNERLLRVSLAADQRYRLYTPLDQIAPALIEATLLYEDQDFYQHAGVDVLALVRAFWATYIQGERRIGASTLTMQLARLRWQIPSHTWQGKLEQIWRALQLSWHFRKDEILEYYFNLAPYGRNIEGVGAASLIYFDKAPQDLSLPEVLALAVLPQNPVQRNPTRADTYQNLTQARLALFERWLDTHPEDAPRRSHFDLPLRVRAPEQLPFHAPHFVAHVQRQLGTWASGRQRTTLDLELQQTVQKALAHYVQTRADAGIHNAAALVLDHRSMQLLAMVGSADFNDAQIHGQVNGTLAKRSPGSTLKPFVYAQALDQGLIHPLTLMKDLPRRFGGFSPENFDQRFVGPLSAREALIQSRNVPAVDLAAQLRAPDFYRFLQDSGVDLPRPASHYGLALALGGAELTMLELISLYATVANRGEQRDIRTLFATSEEPPKPRRRFSAEASFMLLDILKDNPPPDAQTLSPLRSTRNEVAWKTGTSWAFRDAWAFGISGPYVVAVWVGNFDGSSNPALVGRTAAGPLLFQLLERIFPAQSWRVEQLIAPEDLNLKRVKVCARTGDLAEQACPDVVETWFVPGVSPIRMSNIYREIPVRIDNGLRACQHQPGITRLETHAFWPSDFLAIFRLAGLALRLPPDYAEGCALDQTSAQGQAPRMLSPEEDLSYVLTAAQPTLQIALDAAVEPDASRLYWFINDAYFGSAAKDETLLWQAAAGTHQIKVVDDAGRSQTHRVKVVWAD